MSNCQLITKYITLLVCIHVCNFETRFSERNSGIRDPFEKTSYDRRFSKGIALKTYFYNDIPHCPHLPVL